MPKVQVIYDLIQQNNQLLQKLTTTIDTLTTTKFYRGKQNIYQFHFTICTIIHLNQSNQQYSRSQYLLYTLQSNHINIIGQLDLNVTKITNLYDLTPEQYLLQFIQEELKVKSQYLQIVTLYPIMIKQQKLKEKLLVIQFNQTLKKDPWNILFQTPQLVALWIQHLNSLIKKTKPSIIHNQIQSQLGEDDLRKWVTDIIKQNINNPNRLTDHILYKIVQQKRNERINQSNKHRKMKAKLNPSKQSKQKHKQEQKPIKQTKDNQGFQLVAQKQIENIINWEQKFRDQQNKCQQQLSQLSDLRNAKYSLDLQNQNQKKILRRNTQKFQEYENQLKNKQSIIEQKSIQNTQLKNQIQNINIQAKKYKQLIKNYLMQIATLKQTICNQKYELQERQRQYNDTINKQKQSFQGKETKYQETINNQKNLIFQNQTTYQRNINNLHAEKQQLLDKYQFIQKQNQQLIKELEQLQSQLNRSKKNEDKLKTQLITVIEGIQTETSKSRQLQQLNLYLSNQIEQLKHYSIRYFFQGKVLHQCYDQKQFLLTQISKYTYSQIKLTPLLYSFDPLNQVNFHEYFDDQDYICIVIRLRNGSLIAGFSLDGVSRNKAATNGGIICSLTNKQTFPLIQGKKSVTFDKYFLIFGNSQLRIKHGQLQLFTNFGVTNSFYNGRGEKYTVLTGEGSDRQENIDHYEIFKVIFK